MNQQPDKSRLSPIAVLFTGVIAVSFSAILIRWAQEDAVPSLVIATWRTLIATLILLPIALTRRRQELTDLSRQDWGLALLSGAMLGVHFGTWISSLALTSVTSSLVLVSTSPLWVGLASPLLLRESLTKGLKIGIGLALVGSVVIGMNDVLAWQNGRFAIDLAQTSSGSQPLLGNLLALLGALSAAVYLLIGRRLRQSLSLLSYTTVVYGMAALTLLLFTMLFTDHALFGYTPQIYLLFLVMALFPQLIGHTSFNWALGFLPAAYVSVAVISEPIGATLLAVLIFGEIPGPVVLAGSVLILAGIVAATRKETGENN